MGLQIELKNASDHMRAFAAPLLVDSGCELFMFFVQHFPETLNQFEEHRQLLVRRGEYFQQHCAQSTSHIAEKGARFVSDGAVCRL